MGAYCFLDLAQCKWGQDAVVSTRRHSSAPAPIQHGPKLPRSPSAPRFFILHSAFCNLHLEIAPGAVAKIEKEEAKKGKEKKGKEKKTDYSEHDLHPPLTYFACANPAEKWGLDTFFSPARPLLNDGSQQREKCFLSPFFEGISR